MSEKDFWEGYVPEPVKSGEGASATVTITLPAQQALDKKAENARELGLDYEPVWGGGPTNKDYEDAMRQRRLHQLTSPPAQPVQDNPLDCGVHLGSGKDHAIKHHISYGPAQRTWEEWFKWWRTSKVADSTEAEIDFADFMLIVRAVESEYGIKENT
jgi:hypothetical protein